MDHLYFYTDENNPRDPFDELTTKMRRVLINEGRYLHAPSTNNLSTVAGKFQNLPLKPWEQSHIGTGIIYDDEMMMHDCPWVNPDECPERYDCIKKKLIEYELLDKCVVLESKYATVDDVLLVHSPEYYNEMLKLYCEKDVEVLKEASSRYDGIYFNEYTYSVAMKSLGCALKLTDEVINGDTIRNGFALIRTPGHHAMASEANGYCIFNNAAIAARHAITRRFAKKVLIVDWDVHHGQGTQSIFYEDPQVLYFSIHRYEQGKFWPNLAESNFDFIGANAGQGYNINVPLQTTDCTDGDYMQIWYNLLLPVAYEFNPDLVIVSAGFDAAIGCPEGKMMVMPSTFALMCHHLQALANGRIVVLLEGGYNLESLAESAAMTVASLIPSHQLPEDPLADWSSDKIQESLLSAIWALRPKWKFLCLQGIIRTVDEYEEIWQKKSQEFSSNISSIIKEPIYLEDFIPETTPYKDQSTLDTDTCGNREIIDTDFSEQDTSEQTIKKYNIYEVCCEKDLERQERLNKIIETKILRFPKIPQPIEKTTFLAYHHLLEGHASKRTYDHPENPDRYRRPKRALTAIDIPSRCKLMQFPRRATEEDLLRVHSKEYIHHLAESLYMDDEEMEVLSESFDSIYICKKTFDCALLAAGCVLECVDYVMQGITVNAFALIRPPGHHASYDAASGFCFFNNAVIGARYALDKFSDTCKRVLIVDFDYHHGDGIQTCIKNDTRIFYISTHAYDNRREFPHTKLSDFTDGGSNTINIPWNDDPMGDTEYLLAFLNVVLPVARTLKPDLVIVSAGYDAVVDDALGKYMVRPPTYGHLIHHLRTIAGGRLVLCLEGGYNLTRLSESIAHSVAVLLGDPPSRLPNLKEPFESAASTLRSVIQREHKYHKMLNLNKNLPALYY